MAVHLYCESLGSRQGFYLLSWPPWRTGFFSGMGFRHFEIHPVPGLSVGAANAGASGRALALRCGEHASVACVGPICFPSLGQLGCGRRGRACSISTRPGRTHRATMVQRATEVQGHGSAVGARGRGRWGGSVAGRRGIFVGPMRTCCGPRLGVARLYGRGPRQR